MLRLDATRGATICDGLSFFFFKQTTAYEIRKGDWSSDVCSSDLPAPIDSTPRPCLPAATMPKGVMEIGRASCRERVSFLVYISVVAVSLKKKKKIKINIYNVSMFLYFCVQVVEIE